MSEHFEEEEFSTEFNGQTLLRILALTRPHWKWLLGFMLAIAAVAGSDSFLTYLGKRIIDDGIAAQDKAALKSIVVMYSALIPLQAAGVFGFIYMAGLLGHRIRYDLRARMFNHLQTLSLSYFDRTPLGWIMSRVASDSERVSELVTWGLLDVTWGITSIISAVGFMLFINWKLALLVFGIIPVLVEIGRAHV